MVALMVGTAVQRLSSCDNGAGNTADMSMNDSSSDSSDMGNGTTVACEDNSVDIAVTLCLLVGIFMVSVYSKLIAL